MRSLIVLAIFIFVSANSSAADGGAVLLDYRLQPGRDLTWESTTDAITTMRVREDRGIIKKSKGRLSFQPITLHVVSRQTFRYITGAVQSDGSFTTELRFLSKTMSVRRPDGVEQPLPERNPLNGVHVSATIEADGKLRPGSMELSGPDPSSVAPFRDTITSVLAQAASIAPITLARGASVPQEMSMKVPLPIPDMPSLELRMGISNRLLAIEGGVATVEQIHNVSFGTPAAGVKLTAEGTGGGLMKYEIGTKTLLSSDSGTLMNLVLDAPDGVLEMQLNSKQSQKVRPTTPPAR